ncbi:hypothetical protein HCU01_30840 [Halomonas cupida]|uniref:Uncharacterized protein n=1 Tax=Halomonas cupida TaxID=44933 RepID=A0A1M7CAN9_9GAMM|nr:hypothetical protein [Halomonas cupida]GEN25135.1 hypothetical protein HCU01_30840 [Halomonas cupida]SHL64250.1 hypothetical protein SAMN05660971_01026 [Halomonas cupida]
MKASMIGGALLSLMLVSGGASAMDSEALNESREALDQSYMETQEAMENRIDTLEAEVEELKQQLMEAQSEK